MKQHATPMRAKYKALLLRIFIAILLAAVIKTPAFAKEPQEALHFARGFSGNYLAARLAQNGQDTKAAVQFFEHALHRDPSNPYLLQQAFYLNLLNRDIDKALSYTDALLDINGNYELARIVKAIAALKAGNYGTALEELELASSEAPLQLLTSQLLAAWAEAGMERLDEALVRIDQLKGADWYESFRSYHAGLIAEHLGAGELALEHINQAFEHDPSALRIVEAYARLQARQNAQEKALAAIRAFKGQVTSHPYMDAVEADIRAGRHAGLTANVRHGAAEVLFGLGAALSQEGGLDLSTLYLQLSLYLNPRSDLALTTLSELFANQKQYAEAASLAENMPENSPLYEAVEIEASLNLAQISQIDAAIRRLSKVAREVEEATQANVALGNVLRFENRFEEANDIYTMIIDGLDKVEPQHWSLFYSRGITFERTGRWPQAEADFEQALKLNPEHPLVLNYLGYSWIDQNTNLEEALRMIEKALELRPKEGFIIDSLGWAYFRLGRYEEAVEELEKAIKAMPSDPLVHDHLGDAYWKAGRILEAQFQWRHARDLEPEEQELTKILDKIKYGLDNEALRQTEALNSGQSLEQAPANLKTQRTHIVGEGENLWDIAKTYLGSGNAFVDILAINRDRLPENGRLEAGTKLRIPDDT